MMDQNHCISKLSAPERGVYAASLSLAELGPTEAWPL